MGSKKDRNKLIVKQCPFAHLDGEPQDVKMMETDNGFAVVCRCGALGPMRDSHKEALTAWNAQNVMILEKEAFDKLMAEVNEDAEEKDNTDK